jgi:hypothetical protein
VAKSFGEEISNSLNLIVFIEILGALTFSPFGVENYGDVCLLGFGLVFHKALFGLFS